MSAPSLATVPLLDSGWPMTRTFWRRTTPVRCSLFPGDSTVATTSMRSPGWAIVPLLPSVCDASETVNCGAASFSEIVAVAGLFAPKTAPPVGAESVAVKFSLPS